MKGKFYQRGKLVPIQGPAGTPADQPLIRGPCSKIVLQSRKIAKQTMKKIVQKKRLEGRDTELLHIYWCPECEAWHIGHRWAKAGEEGS